MSMSPMVSRNRRRLPQYSILRTSGKAPKVATSSFATGIASMMGVRRCLPARPSRSIDLAIFSSLRAPSPGQVA